MRSTAIAMLALFIAVGGTAFAAKKLINGRDIKNRSVSTAKLKKSAVKSLRRKANRPVTGDRIVNGTITGSDLAPRSVGNDQVVDRSLSGGKLRIDAITSTELGVGAAGEEEIAPNSVGNSEIKGNSISRNQLRSNVVRTGRVTLDFGDVAAGCKALTADAATYSLPAGAFTDAVVVIGAPAALPDGLVVEGRSPSGDDLRVQLCNLTGAPIAVGEQTFPYSAFGT